MVGQLDAIARNFWLTNHSNLLLDQLVVAGALPVH
jgi:hypothetical protein